MAKIKTISINELLEILADHFGSDSCSDFKFTVRRTEHSLSGNTLSSLPGSYTVITFKLHRKPVIKKLLVNHCGECPFLHKRYYLHSFDADCYFDVEQKLTDYRKEHETDVPEWEERSIILNNYRIITTRVMDTNPVIPIPEWCKLKED